MTEIGTAAKRLLAGEPGEGDSPTQLAERATQAYERLAAHLARLLGGTGVQMLFSRSVVIVSARETWLPSGTDPAGTLAAIREAMEQQDPASISNAFVAILSTLVDLLKRLIGDGLVERLLNEVWPSVFVIEVKDIP